MIKIWILAQIPCIVSESNEIINENLTRTWTVIYWETSQVFKSTIGLTLNSLEISINYFPLLFFVFYRYVKTSNFFCKKVTIDSGMKRENKHGSIFPLSGEVVNILKFEDKTIWLLTKLDQSFEYKGVEYSSVLIYPKEGKNFSVNNRQLGYMKLISPDKNIDNLEKIKNEYQFIDYVGIEIT